MTSKHAIDVRLTEHLAVFVRARSGLAREAGLLPEARRLDHSDNASMREKS